MLALLAALTARNEAPVLTTFASTDFGPAGYRAWATLLEREGISTARFLRRPIELDSRVDTLISAQPVAAAADPAARTAADLGALAAWVRGGGHLVYIGRNAALTAAENQALELPFLLPDVGARGRPNGPLVAGAGSLAALGTNRMLLVEHAGNALYSDGNGDIVVRYSLGRGQIVAIVDAVPFTNEHIARAGNARLAYALSTPGRTGGVVAFDDGVHGALVDRPWYRALSLPVRLSLSIAGVAVLLGCIGSALRGSPPMALQAAREPTSREFVEALAALHERIDARAAARDVLAHAALAAAARRAGLSDNVAPELLAQRLGDRHGGNEIRQIAATLATPPASDAALIASAKLASTLRKESLHDGTGDRPRSAFTGRSRTRRRW